MASIKILEFLVDSIFLVFAGKVFQLSAFQWAQIAPLF